MSINSDIDHVTPDVEKQRVSPQPKSGATLNGQGASINVASGTTSQLSATTNIRDIMEVADEPNANGVVQSGVEENTTASLEYDGIAQA